MVSQGERVLGVLGMDLELVESMAQDENPEQDISVQEQFPPQPNPEPEMGAVAEAAVYDTPLPTSVKSPPRPPAKPRPMVADRSCFRHPSSHKWWR